jgi:hypothetical protein
MSESTRTPPASAHSLRTRVARNRKLSCLAALYSKSTRSPASSAREPSPSMALKCTHASSPSGSAGDEIAPQPFAGLKNFTVPCAMATACATNQPFTSRFVHRNCAGVDRDPPRCSSCPNLGRSCLDAQCRNLRLAGPTRRVRRPECKPTRSCGEGTPRRDTRTDSRHAAPGYSVIRSSQYHFANLHPSVG